MGTLHILKYYYLIIFIERTELQREMGLLFTGSLAQVAEVARAEPI